MITVQAWRTEDGVLHETEDDAIAHMVEVNTLNWLDLMANRPASLEPEDLYAWLLAHEDYIVGVYHQICNDDSA